MNEQRASRVIDSRFSVRYASSAYFAKASSSISFEALQYVATASKALEHLTMHLLLDCVKNCRNIVDRPLWRERESKGIYDQRLLTNKLEV